jgi:hypothetical protein
VKLDTIVVSLAVMAGIAALIGVPVRCWQQLTGRHRSQIPAHAVAQATFGALSAVFYALATLGWCYALYAAYVDYSCTANCGQRGAGTALALGLLGCAYALLEGFLFTARRRRSA